MKKYAIILALCLITAIGIISVLAAGDAVDPLISLSYLTGTYRESLDAAVEDKLDAADQAIQDDTTAKLDAAGIVPGMSWADTWTESRLKSGDTLYGSTGLSVLVLAGDAAVTFDSGAVVDVTTGETVTSGSTLAANHRYMAAEDTVVQFTVTSKTAVVKYMGQYGITLSDAVDYNAMAGALKTINLFRGSHTGYGSGFDLEAAPTRLQALIMFIRVLGEEEAALAYTGTPPFEDIQPGSTAAKYVGYAYEMGYTNGYTATLWKPSNRTNVYQYTEFLLRALGYSSVENTHLSDALVRAQSVGVMTAGEAASMASEKFLRAHLVYLSYYALEVPAADSGIPLRDVLISKGVFTMDDYTTATALVNSLRTS